MNASQVPLQHVGSAFEHPSGIPRARSTPVPPGARPLPTRARLPSTIANVTVPGEPFAMPERIGPYRIIAALAEGGMGIVYLAEHTLTRARVALKTVRMPHEGMLSGLRREIHALARLRHPGVVPVIEHGLHAGVPWYVMPVLEGRTLGQLFASLEKASVKAFAPTRATALTATAEAQPSVSALEPLAPETLAPEAPIAHATPPEPPMKTTPRARARGETTTEVRLPGGRPRTAPGIAPGADPLRPAAGGALPLVLSVFREICVTLAFVHGEGVIHRDLKPGNVFLDPAGAPVLLDFGIAAQSPGAISREEIDVAGAQGTASYMAPEQIHGELVDARADLYAVGCLLFEALTTRPPFVGPTPSNVLMQHLSAEPYPPSSFAAGVPPALDALVLRLLEKRPRDRPGHADDIARALEALGAARLRPAPEVAPRAYVYRPEIVGRSRALAVLTHRLARASGGHGGVVLVGGESGIGKTYLAMSVAQRGRAHGLEVVTGTSGVGGVGAAGSGSRERPALLHAFRPFLQAVADRCRAEGPDATARILGDRTPWLLPFAPELGDLPGSEPEAAPPELSAELARARRKAALIEVLLAYARSTPLLLVLDDIQWADELSLELVEALAGERLDEEPLLVLGTYRAEEMSPALAALAARREVAHLGLDRLDEASVGAMVSGMLALESPPSALVGFLARRSLGNPLYVAEYLRAAVDAGLLRRSPAGLGWEIDAGAEGPESAAAYERLPLPRALEELIVHHLSGLEEGALRLARAASVLGSSIEAELLAEVAGLDEAASLEALRELTVRHILEEAEPGRLRFLHDKLREVAYGGIAPKDEQALHARAARALEAFVGRSPTPARYYGRLAHHFQKARRTEKAVAYLEKAGLAALESFANREASSLFEALLALRLEAILGLRAAGIAKAREEPRAIAALVRSGAVPEAAQLALSRCERYLAEACAGLGEVEAQARHGRAALAWAGRPAPEDDLGWALRLPVEVAIQAAHRLAPGLTRCSDAARAIEVERAQGMGRLVEATFTRGSRLAQVTSILACVNAAERAEAGIPVAKPYAALGAVFTRLHLSRVGARYFALAREGEGRGEPGAHVAYAAWIEATALMWRGRLIDADAVAARGEARAVAAGERPLIESLWLTRGLAAWLRGDLARALALAERAWASAAERGNRQVLGWSLNLSTQSAIDLGRLDAAEAALARSIPFEVHPELPDEIHLARLLCSARLELARGHLGEAFAAAEELRAALPERALSFLVGEARVTVVEVYLACLEASRGAPPALAAARARGATRDLRRSAFLYPVFAPRSDRLRGRLHRLEGDNRRAAWLLERAIQGARAAAMAREEAAARRELSLLQGGAGGGTLRSTR